MTKPTPEDTALEALFAEAAQAPPQPSDALLARIAVDAEATQHGFMPAPAPVARDGAPWQRWLAEIGGFPALGGLAVSACVGVYIGFANPDMGQDLGLSVQSFAGLESSADPEDPFSTPLLGDFEWIEEG